MNSDVRELRGVFTATANRILAALVTKYKFENHKIMSDYCSP